jgi:hypothetical protein
MFVHCFTGNRTLQCLDPQIVPLASRTLFRPMEKPQQILCMSPRTSPSKQPVYEHGTIFREASWLDEPHRNGHMQWLSREGNVQKQVSYPSRHELVQQMAPRYQEASRVQKSFVLNAFVAVTGSSRRYAMQLLNHPEVLKPSIRRPRPPHDRPEVQHALFLAWKAANQICATRLIPFLPTLVDALERHGHLHLTEECRKQLLSISAPTADRFLRSQRKAGPRGISTTRAGTLLKNQIPIRTFQDWNEAQPGFLEADLVAHCGIHAEGGYLYAPSAHRQRDGLDRMSPSSLPQSGDSAGNHPARSNALSFSSSRQRYR